MGTSAMNRRLSQILWFIGLWTASIAALGIVAYAIRAMIL